MGFTKLDDGLSGSSLLCQGGLELVGFWAILLSKANSEGRLSDSVPALARTCGVSVGRVEEFLKVLSDPDPYSRTPDHEGRRIKVEKSPRLSILILNHAAHRAWTYSQSKDAIRKRAYRLRSSERDITGHVSDVSQTSRDSRGHSVSASVSVQTTAQGSDHTPDPERPRLESEALRLSREIGAFRHPGIREDQRGTEHAAIMVEFTSFQGKGGVVNPATIRSKERLQHAVLRMREEVARLSAPQHVEPWDIPLKAQ